MILISVLFLFFLLLSVALLIYITIKISSPVECEIKKCNNNTELILDYYSQDSTKRIVAFMPNFEPNGGSYKGIQYGYPENYTHVIIGFVVPYHYYMGKDVTGGCSTLCNLSTGSYFVGMDDQTADEITQTIVTQLQAKNPNVNIMFSFGGWNLDNLKCNYACSADMDPLQFYYKDYMGNPHNVGDCTPISSSSVFPSQYCMQSGAKNVAQHLLSLVTKFKIQGIDLDFESTHVYENFSDPLRKQYLSFYRELVTELKTQNPSILLSISPQSPYVIKSSFPNSYQFHQDWLTTDIVKDIDFINVQFYNNEPEDTNIKDDPTKLITLYKTLADQFTPEKVTFGMCTAREDSGVCKYCTFNTLQGSIANNYCTDPNWRLNNIISPLFKEYGDKFGGIMFWNTAGDPDGVFSSPFKKLFGGSSPPPSKPPTVYPPSKPPTVYPPSKPPTVYPPSKPPTVYPPSKPPTVYPPSKPPTVCPPCPPSKPPTVYPPSKPPSTTCIPLWGNCTHNSCCEGSICKKQDDYYSQCIPDPTANCTPLYDPCKMDSQTTHCCDTTHNKCTKVSENTNLCKPK